MAKLEIEGLDDLISVFAQLSNVPDKVVNDSLIAMQDVAMDKIKASGEAYGIRDPESDVHILDKLKKKKPKITETGGYADIYFSGTRTRDKTKTKNSTIAFMNEFGKRKQAARPFVGEAMNKGADEIAKAGGDVLLDWIEDNFKE